jgi:ribose transport system substrate-binding protein
MRSTGRRTTLTALMALAALVLALGLAACGGGDSSSSSANTESSEESSGGSAAEESTTAADEESGEGEEAEAEGGGGEEIVPAPPTEPPTENPVDEPLKTTPPPSGKKVIWLACSLPTCQGALSSGYKKAAAALGWQFEQINYNTLKAAEGVQQAINKNPDYIFITGIPVEAFETQAQEAIKKGIPIFSGFEPTTVPEPEKNGIYMNYLNNAGIGAENEMLGDWIINDSGGTAKTLSVEIPEYPTLVAGTETFTKHLEEKCPECEAGVLDVTVEDVEGGKVPSKVVAYIQQHPDVEYIEWSFSDLSTGVEAALQAAGIEGIKSTGLTPTEPIIKEIIDGKQAAWIAQPQEFGGWTSMDAAIRTAEGMPITKYQKSGLAPIFVVDSKEAAEQILEEGGEWPGPTGFEASFEELWGLK